jgi:methylase of polypeptide subunit release factors
MGSKASFEPVMYVGPDTLGLLAIHQHLRDRTAGRVIEGRALLDVCAGCGVQGIAAAVGGLAAAVVMLELNDRAIRFAEFNCVLNGVDEFINVKVSNVHICKN